MDQVAWVIAPKIVGGRDAKTSVEGVGVDGLEQAPDIQVKRLVPLGKDFLLEGYVRP